MEHDSPDDLPKLAMSIRGHPRQVGGRSKVMGEMKYARSKFLNGSSKLLPDRPMTSIALR
jgi:hypothetical protein